MGGIKDSSGDHQITLWSLAQYIPSLMLILEHGLVTSIIPAKRMAQTLHNKAQNVKWELHNTPYMGECVCVVSLS